MAESMTMEAPTTQRRKPVIPNGVLGMIIFAIAESMFFAGLISAFMIVRASSKLGWPPPGQPRLPAEQTVANTAVLILSGVVLVVAWKLWQSRPQNARWALLASVVLGALFLLLQGREWVALIGQGLTLTSSSQGSFFYLIVGIHGLHALAALGALVVAYRKLVQGTLQREFFLTAQVFWYFVVALWPFIYVRVYF